MTAMMQHCIILNIRVDRKILNHDHTLPQKMKSESDICDPGATALGSWLWHQKSLPFLVGATFFQSQNFDTIQTSSTGTGAFVQPFFQETLQKIEEFCIPRLVWMLLKI